MPGAIILVLVVVLVRNGHVGSKIWAGVRLVCCPEGTKPEHLCTFSKQRHTPQSEDEDDEYEDD